MLSLYAGLEETITLIFRLLACWSQCKAPNAVFRSWGPLLLSSSLLVTVVSVRHDVWSHCSGPLDDRQHHSLKWQRKNLIWQLFWVLEIECERKHLSLLTWFTLMIILIGSQASLKFHLAILLQSPYSGTPSDGASALVSVEREDCAETSTW